MIIKPLIVNFISGPASGKTTLASKIFSRLKQDGVSVGLVTEFATQCIMEKQTDIFNYQYFISANQLYRQETTEKQYSIVVTDSPILLFLVYGEWDEIYNKDDNQEKINKGLENFYLGKYHQKNNLMFYIERNPDLYTPENRINTLEEAYIIDEKILEILNKYKIDYIKIKNNLENEDYIFELIKFSI